MSSSGEAWDEAAVFEGIGETRFAGLVRHFPTVSSTSTLALEAAGAGAAEGQVWVADEQTAGRGRGGHTWHSEPGAGLYVSILLRPALALADALHLSLATGLAVQAAVAEMTRHAADLRWPNDLLLDEKKFGGILVETAISSPSTLRHAVVGIGINVGHTSFPPELEALATSLRLATGTLYAREVLLSGMLRALERELVELENGSSTLLERFTRGSTWVKGKAVRLGEQGGYTGVTAGLDERGFLRVLDDAGALRTVLSGGVRPR